jgi:hypothetical protein
MKQDNHSNKMYGGFAWNKDPLQRERRENLEREYLESQKPVRRVRAKKAWRIDPRYTREEIQHFERQMTARLREGQEPERFLSRHAGYRQKLNPKWSGYKSLLKAFDRVEEVARSLGHTS